MQYRTFAPPEVLAPFIKYFWVLQSDDSSGAEKTFSAIPDGSPGIIMVRSDKEAFCLDHNKKLPNIFLYGQTITSASFSSAGKLGAIGVCFQPHALKSIFGMDANELTGSCVDINLLGNNKKNSNLSQRFSDAATVDEQIKVLSLYLFDKLQRNTRLPDDPTKYAITQITGSKGHISLKELQGKLQLSERSLERKFKDAVGISPKLFSRIIRFQETMAQLRSNDYDKLSDIAYENNYADQSHFIRVFKEFTGFSPFEFKKRSEEVVENFPEIKK